MDIVDYPMHCCGIVEASGFGGGWIYSGDGERPARRHEDKDFNYYLDKVEEHQLKHRRNCALISLASHQMVMRGIAEKRGYKSVFQFYNPNSGFNVDLYTKVLWEGPEAYETAKSEGYLVPRTNDWADMAEPYAVEPKYDLEVANAV